LSGLTFLYCSRMAFFKFRKGTDEPAVAAEPSPQSLESLRQRAKYRLAGATVLVLAAVICLPLLLDSQPRPVAVDMPIDIPDKTKLSALRLDAPDVAAAAPAARASVAAPAAQPGGFAPAIITETADSPLNRAAPVATVSAEKLAAAPAAKASTAIKSEAIRAPAQAAPEGVSSKAADGQQAKVAEAARARALLETGAEPTVVARAAAAASRPVSGASDAGAERFVVQIGAFAESERAQEVRQKVERAGLKTYTHVAQTKDGSRIRVRVGPFASRDEADKAAARVKKLDLPAAVLTL